LLGCDGSLGWDTVSHLLIMDALSMAARNPHEPPSLCRPSSNELLTSEKAGWRVFRLDGGVKEQDVLAEQVADLILAMEAHAEEIFVNHSFSTPEMCSGRRTVR
jgi:hypothetical protein